MSNVPASPLFRASFRVSSANPIRSSILSATPASCQKRHAIPVNSSLISQVTICPFSGRASAITRQLYPVKVPTSTILFASTSRTNKAMNCPWSGEICIRPFGIFPVSSRNFSSIGRSRNELSRI